LTSIHAYNYDSLIGIIKMMEHHFKGKVFGSYRDQVRTLGGYLASVLYDIGFLAELEKPGELKLK
jgi:hypothetical protein